VGTDRNEDPLIKAMGEQLAARMPAEKDLTAEQKRVRVARSAMLKMGDIARRTKKPDQPK
jgi:hypothetical protein